MEGARARRGSRVEREALWRRRIEEQARGGMTAREFCRREGVSEPSFYQWRRRLAARPQGAQGDRRQAEPERWDAERGARSARGGACVPGAPKFARVLAGEPEAARRGLIEIQSRGGFVVRVEPGFDRAALAEALGAIQALAAEASGR